MSIKVKEFIDSTNCMVRKAYNHHSKDTYSNPFSKNDIGDKINNFLENNEIEVINLSYTQGITYEKQMSVHVSKALLTYKDISIAT